MNPYDWKQLIKLNLLKLKFVGLFPSGSKTYQRDWYTCWAVSILTIFNFLPNLCQTIKMILMADDLDAVVASSFVTLPEILSLIKACFVVHNMKTLKQLMLMLESKTFQPKNQKQIKIAKFGYKFWRLIYKFYWTMSIGAIFFWSMYPILDNALQDYQLPFPAWYPFNVKVSPTYQIMYMYQILGVICIATTAVSVDTLICALNAYIGIQFDLLCDNLKHIFAKKKSLNSSVKLVECIRHHRQIVEFAENTNTFSNWIILLQFLISAISIGITLFRLTVVIPFSSEFFSLTSFFSSITLEIFMFCWFGNEVEIKVSKIILLSCDLSNVENQVVSIKFIIVAVL